MNEVSRPENLFTSREFRAVLVGTAVLLLLGYAFLTFLAQRTDALMVDMTAWEVRFSTADPEPPISRKEFSRFLRGAQSPIGAQHPFRLTLQLPRKPKKGDLITASRDFAAADSGTYCFAVLTFSDYHQPDSQRAVDTFEVRVRIQDTVVASFPIADRKAGQFLEFRDLRPENGQVRIQLELQARGTRSRPFWQKASTVHFELARFYPCARSS